MIMATVGGGAKSKVSRSEGGVTGVDPGCFVWVAELKRKKRNERSSADSLFRKGNAKLYLFHFEQHLDFISNSPGLQHELADKTDTDGWTESQCSNLRFAPALDEPLRNNKRRKI